MIAASWDDCGSSAVRVGCILADWTAGHAVRVLNDDYYHNPDDERVHGLW
jgi:hypothetical protein